MKRHLCILLLLVASTGCSSGGKIENDFERLDRSLENMRSVQADQTTQIAAMQTLIQQLQGRIEEFEFNQNRRIASEVTAPRDDLHNLTKRVPPPPIVPASTLEDDEAALGSFPPNVAGSFNEAFIKLREGRFADALPLFQGFVQSGGSGEWVPMGQFWLGVTYDGLGENRNALASYNDLISQYPHSPRVPLALLRQGSVLVRLGDSKSAALVYKKITAEYPKTVEAAQAEAKLKNL